jgi:fluoride exporter
MITKWLLLAVFGAIGTVARAEVSALVQRLAGPLFPWGTVGVNLIGSLLFGVVWASTAGHARAGDIRFFGLTGFMGAFTTFSTLMFDTEQLAEASRLGAAAGNLLLQNGAGLVCIVLGLALGRAL